MKKTIFYDTHIKLGAKMAPFGGYDMPIQYEGIIAEHRYTRTAATLFDTCHMGEFLIEGAQACTDLETIVSCDVSVLQPGKCKYGFLCNPEGGVIDDLIIYRLSPESFFLVVNASTADADFSWISGHLSAATSRRNLSQETAKIDLQGPHSAKIACMLLNKTITELSYYSFTHVPYKAAPLLISRTGYTGELGFELYLDAPRALTFWNEAMELGAKPAGLGARDTLRLEMGFPLYGHELDENRNAAESTFTQAISTTKTFIGSTAVRKNHVTGHMLTGIRLMGRRAARAGDAVFDKDGSLIGAVTSGSFAPTLGYAVALAYVASEKRQPDTAVLVGSDRYRLDGTITTIPFFKNATARKKIADYV